MRKILLAGLVILMAACESENEGYQISGTVQNAPDGQKLIISELNDSNTQVVHIDTIEIKEGKFELDLPEKEQPTISFLTVEGTRGNVVYIAGNSPVEFTVYPDSIYSSEISGGPDNEVLSTYLKSVKGVSKKMGEHRNAAREAMMNKDSVALQNLQAFQEQLFEEDKQTKASLVESNPNSIVSVMILQDMLNTSAYSSAELKGFYEQLSPEVKELPLAKIVKTRLDKMSKTAVGSKAPEFSAPTPEGNELALNDALGKVTLVDFWASWCKPCRVENPNIVEVYKKYHDQGFNIIQVSLDRPGQKDKWIQAIEDDNLGAWNHVSNLMFWQDPVAVDYGIRAIPAAFLLDENGKIIAKDLRGDALGQKVGEVLNNSSSN
ncbi:TlpA disulfide reductase family protein [Salinimicrobium sp. MT39]|uniref:TlpA disulfide reductase family protein n=1 Tax=Salinimicrobium profundisediminis TaxID=2994553 RepID=A0A9X3CVZ4_9FLAO|nr:TlpA disulfide reductase family protein [Salinimicrobium profundisediminis]MCX2837942.1 TlpA disulfide reductase family protein [Salinimicrobium profundisediminis]